MNREGPFLESLTRRISETRDDFLAEPRIDKTGVVQVAAVAGDLCRRLGHEIDSQKLLPLSKVDAKSDRTRLGIALVICWLLDDPWFKGAGIPLESLMALLDDGANELARHTTSAKLVADPDRREELARFALARLGYRPAGETVAQAQDRLTTLSAAERARVLSASRAAEQRARAIREALARKAAEESADKYTRE